MDRAAATAVLTALSAAVPPLRASLATTATDYLPVAHAHFASGDVEGGLAIVRAGAATGCPHALYVQGIALIDGLCMPADPAAGVALLMRAAASAHSVAAHAQASLAHVYEVGAVGVPRDAPAASRLYRTAAEAGHVAAASSLAHSLVHGDGVAQDLPGAAVWARVAAEAGNCDGAALLGHMLLFGHGVPVNEVEAVRWLTSSARGDSAAAAQYLGDAYADGLGGLAVDAAEARRWYLHACKLYNDEPARQRGALARLHSLRDTSLEAAVRAAMPPPVPPLCGHGDCGGALDAGTLSGLCGGCRRVRYCGDDCQRAAWLGHRSACREVATARACWLEPPPLSPPPASSPPGASPPSCDPGLPLPSFFHPRLVSQGMDVAMWRRMPLPSLRAAAEAGNAAAQWVLGLALKHSMQGAAEDAGAAAQWQRAAAEQGLAVARTSLGLAASLRRDTSTAAAASEMVAWLRPAAELGYPPAQQALCNPLRVLADAAPAADAVALRSEAGQWLRAAVAQGNAEAMEDMGCRLWNGDAGGGIERDVVAARAMWAAADAAGADSQTRARRDHFCPGWWKV